VDLVAEFAAAAIRNGTNTIMFVGSLRLLDELSAAALELRRYALDLLYAPVLRDRSVKFLDVVPIGPHHALRFVRAPMSDFAVVQKRALDLLLAMLGIVVLMPLLLVAAIAIVLDSTGPVIYRQARRGFNGEIFMMWKFRSMKVTESGYDMREAKEGDPRITRVGRFIRATSIDELPQLVNVVLGSMSLVGPRPHAISHDARLSEQLATYAHRQRIKPGITGWAQVHGYRGDTSSPEAVVSRIEHDMYYIEHWSLPLDLWIMVLTVFAPAARRNAR
jgi:exopolysaccharide biosynthesis polyprenyl glycosylphosphotransferase